MVQTAFALILFLAPLAYSPGPGNLFFAANGARFGLRATLPANAGYHLATWIVTAAIGMGFLAATARHPQIFAALKTAGAAYVLWLAWRLARAGRHDSDRAARPAGFVDGAVLLLLNPKAYVIIALMFTQFLGTDATGTLAPVLLIATVFTLNNLLAFLAWTWAGDALAARFADEQDAARLNTGFAVLLAGVALWMLLA
ncbi:Threonine/homoserine/homoserine lactone efflux protein [Palleronia salina]|uniref:Threonine/homoserine/homoserine lactone efflux protein n=1 Tax=Palleronia salina TaxID=313368 RepID=A0A1M6BA04_9RHOB|nr:LysE family translocator [Palleronia salina]SHI45303.1 Threonine/homoserine/homoserine lactone efflux protein [Palleronia salina]